MEPVKSLSSVYNQLVATPVVKAIKNVASIFLWFYALSLIKEPGLNQNATRLSTICL